MAEHATEVNDYLMKNLGLTQYECDEIWTFVKKGMCLAIQVYVPKHVCTLLFVEQKQH
jgi:hypothetical protein